MDFIATMAKSCKISKKPIAVNPAIILKATECAMMKMLKQNLNEKDGHTVQSVATTSLEFIVALVINLRILIYFDAVRWFQVKTSKDIKMYFQFISNSISLTKPKLPV